MMQSRDSSVAVGCWNSAVRSRNWRRRTFSLDSVIGHVSAGFQVRVSCVDAWQA
jgi:hypothetical protein